MGPLLLPLPVLAILLAACDTAFVRWGEPARPRDVGLFFHAYFLWALFGLAALLPAAWTLRFLDRRSKPWPERGFDARPWVVLLGWMVLPVALQARLDAHTTLVGFGGLAALRPWLEVLATLAGSALALAWVARSFGTRAGLRAATVGVLLSFGIGLAVPTSSAATPLSAPAARPNLLLLVWDTCRADKLEAYGHERVTSPGLAELAGESLLFEDALSASTFTFTSHLSMLTGVHPLTHGAHLLDMRADPTRAESIAATLRAAGYRTGAFVGTDVLAGRTGLQRGFEVYDDRVDPSVCDTFAWRFVHALQSLAAEFVPTMRFNGRPHWIQDFQRPASEVLRHALAWIERPDPRPWFCFVNLYDVHWPYLPEGEGRELVRPYEGPVDGFLFRSDRWQDGYRLQPEDKRHVNELYEGELFDLDTEVRAFVERLELARGDTAVLLTSDHGEGLGEGETWNHDDVREPQVRIPMILRVPGARPEGRRLQVPASGVDVAPTLLALAGLDVPRNMEGRDLRALAAREEPRERWVDDRDHLDPNDHRLALYSGRFKLVRFGSAAEARYELYDLGAEPAGFRDVSAAHPEVLAELVARLESRAGQARPLETPLESSAHAALEALGYAGDE